MRSGLLILAALVVGFTPTVSAEDEAAAPACVTTYDPQGGLYPPRVDPSTCTAPVTYLIERVVGKPA